MKECIKSAGLATLAGADILELRFDCLYLSRVQQINEGGDSENSRKQVFELVPKNVSDVNVSEAIKRFKESIEKPVIFTCRNTEEGGHFQGTEEERINILSMAIESEVSWIDLEININQKTRKKLFSDAKKSNTKVVASYHDVNKTPIADEIISMIEENKDAGDLVKLCFSL